jgi:imidazolonepropionase-like amidohydrolase
MMDRRDFLRNSALFGSAGLLHVTSCGCVSLSKPLKPAKFPVPPGSRVLLKNGRIVDVEGERIVYPGQVLVRDKIIEEVAERSDIPRADITIDLKGGYVMPGLINNHCHLTFPGTADPGSKFLLSALRQMDRNAEECLRHGVTTVRDMLGFSGVIERMKRDIAKGRMLGPRILRCTALQVKGGYLSPLTWIAGDDMISIVGSAPEARDAVAKACDDGADFIKTFLQYTQLWIPAGPIPVLGDEELTAINDEAERRGRVVAVHHTNIEGFRRALGAGISSFEHMPRDELLTDADIEAFIKKGASVIPTVSVAWSLSNRRNGDPYSEHPEVSEIIEDRKARLEKMLNEFAEEGIKEIALKYFRRFSDPGYFDHWHLMPTPEPKIFNSAAVIGSQNLNRLAEAGALIGCGNDGGVPFLLTFPGAMVLEMELLQRIGIKPNDILKMATINNAKILRMSDKIGSIRKGKLADIVILSANPFEDTENLGKIEKVFLEGQLKFSAPEED